jgi:hypothetical protein
MSLLRERLGRAVAKSDAAAMDSVLHSAGTSRPSRISPVPPRMSPRRHPPTSISCLFNPEAATDSVLGRGPRDAAQDVQVLANHEQ